MRIRRDFATVQLRKKEGAARNEAWAGLTPHQKLASLDARLGKGVGAKRQRALLARATA